MYNLGAKVVIFFENNAIPSHFFINLFFSKIIVFSFGHINFFCELYSDFPSHFFGLGCVVIF